VEFIFGERAQISAGDEVRRGSNENEGGEERAA
jgi:hypothetical protein